MCAALHLDLHQKQDEHVLQAQPWADPTWGNNSTDAAPQRRVCLINLLIYMYSSELVGILTPSRTSPSHALGLIKPPGPAVLGRSSLGTLGVSRGQVGNTTRGKRNGSR